MEDEDGDVTRNQLLIVEKGLESVDSGNTSTNNGNSGIHFWANMLRSRTASKDTITSNPVSLGDMTDFPNTQPVVVAMNSEDVFGDTGNSNF